MAVNFHPGESSHIPLEPQEGIPNECHEMGDEEDSEAMRGMSGDVNDLNEAGLVFQGGPGKVGGESWVGDVERGVSDVLLEPQKPRKTR